MSSGPRTPVEDIAPFVAPTAEQVKEADYKRYVEQHSRLPKQIVFEKCIYHLEYSYMNDVVDRYFLGYSTAAKHPDKKVLLFYEEGNKYEPVLKAWRKFAEKGVKVV